MSKALRHDRGCKGDPCNCKPGSVANLVGIARLAKEEEARRAEEERRRYDHLKPPSGMKYCHVCGKNESIYYKCPAKAEEPK